RPAAGARQWPRRRQCRRAGARRGGVAALAGVCGGASVGGDEPQSTQRRTEEDGMTGVDIFESATPLGSVTGAARDGTLLALTFSESWAKMEARLRRRFPRFESRRVAIGIERRLAAYFAGDLSAFEDLPLDPGGTEFQSAVWAALRRIPSGGTTT